MIVRNSLIKDSRGSVGIVFGLTALLVFIAVGTGIDYGRAVTTRTTLQAATDAAAAAAAAAPPGSDAIALATTVFQANYTASPAPQLDVAVTGDRVTVTAATTIKTSLMAVSGVKELSVSASAEAETYASPLCILLLEKTQIGLSANSNSKVDAGGCGIHINSTNGTNALSVNSNATITAASVCVAGGSNASGGAVTPTPTHGCPGKDDPLASLPEPAEAAGACQENDYKVPSGQTKTMAPKVYCGKTEISGTAIMQPGRYIFRGGEVKVSSNAIVTGSEVMMFFQGKDTRLNVDGNSIVEVTAPKSGTYEGVVMFQSRHTDTLSAPPHIFNSNASTEVEGVIYLPNGILEVNSNAVVNGLADYTIIIARRMRTDSNGTLQMRSNYSGNTPRPPMLARFNTIPSARLVR